MGFDFEQQAFEIFHTSKISKNDKKYYLAVLIKCQIHVPQNLYDCDGFVTTVFS